MTKTDVAVMNVLDKILRDLDGIQFWVSKDKRSGVILDDIDHLGDSLGELLDIIHTDPEEGSLLREYIQVHGCSYTQSADWFTVHLGRHALRREQEDIQNNRTAAETWSSYADAATESLLLAAIANGVDSNTFGRAVESLMVLTLLVRRWAKEPIV